MTTAREGRSPLVSEALLIEAEAGLPYINFCQSKIDTNTTKMLMRLTVLATI